MTRKITLSAMNKDVNGVRDAFKESIKTHMSAVLADKNSDVASKLFGATQENE